jgi:hypothetical protein
MATHTNKRKATEDTAAVTNKKAKESKMGDSSEDDEEEVAKKKKGTTMEALASILKAFRNVNIKDHSNRKWGLAPDGDDVIFYVANSAKTCNTVEEMIKERDYARLEGIVADRVVIRIDGESDMYYVLSPEMEDLSEGEGDEEEEEEEEEDEEDEEEEKKETKGPKESDKDEEEEEEEEEEEKEEEEEEEEEEAEKKETKPAKDSDDDEEEECDQCTECGDSHGILQGCLLCDQLVCRNCQGDGDACKGCRRSMLH